MTKPAGLSVHGTGTFMPQKLETIVGIAMTIVIEASTFMTMLRLFEMTEAKASIMPARTSV